MDAPTLPLDAVQATRESLRPVLAEFPPPIPTEWLDATEEFRRLRSSRLRLDLAARFFAALITGRGDMADRTPSGVRAWCWRMADEFVRDSQKPPEAHAAAACRLAPATHPDRGADREAAV